MILLERLLDLFQKRNNLITNFLGKTDKRSKIFWKRRTEKKFPRIIWEHTASTTKAMGTGWWKATKTSKRE